MREVAHNGARTVSTAKANETIGFTRRIEYMRMHRIYCGAEYQRMDSIISQYSGPPSTRSGSSTSSQSSFNGSNAISKSKIGTLCARVCMGMCWACVRRQEHFFQLKNIMTHWMIWKFCETFPYSSSSSSSFQPKWFRSNFNELLCNALSSHFIICPMPCVPIRAAATQISINAFSMKTKHQI